MKRKGKEKERITVLGYEEREKNLTGTEELSYFSTGPELKKMLIWV